MSERGKTSRTDKIALQISMLTLEEMVYLNKRMREILGEDDPDIGVREPRRPLRPSAAGSIAIDLDEY